MTNYLGGVTTDNGRIVAAEATFIQWFGRINSSDITEDDISSMGTGEIVDRGSLEWEAALRDLLLGVQASLPPGMETFVNVARGFSDIAGDTIGGDALMMPVSFMIMFVYVTVMLGKFSCVQQRGLLALAGLACIGLSIGFTYGFCSALGLFYGPMHNLIPFLLLGIGVDDMFVIMQCFDNLRPEERDLTAVPAAVALTMRRAGVAITVTSLTDFAVFALGATTVLPALRSFCLWCGVGILATYTLQVTLFAAALALDCRRLHQARNGCCPCYTHAAASPGSAAPDPQDTVSRRLFSALADCVLSVPGRVAVLGLALAALGCGAWQCSGLRQEFQSVWFLPPSSYLRQWFTANAEYFPGDGERVVVYIAEVELSTNLDKVEELVTKLEAATDIIKSVDSWYPALKTFCNRNLGTDIPDTALAAATFAADLTQFLYNADNETLGLRFIPSFQWAEAGAELVCGEAAPELLLSTFTFTHRKFSGREEHVPALNTVKQIIDSCGFEGLVFPFNQVTHYISNYSICCKTISLYTLLTVNVMIRQADSFMLSHFLPWKTNKVVKQSSSNYDFMTS